jgi:hypothetical protein
VVNPPDRARPRIDELVMPVWGLGLIVIGLAMLFVHDAHGHRDRVAIVVMCGPTVAGLAILAQAMRRRS